MPVNDNPALEEQADNVSKHSGDIKGQTLGVVQKLADLKVQDYATPIQMMKMTVKK